MSAGNVKTWIVALSIVTLATVWFSPALASVWRRFRSVGAAFGIVAFGFLVSMATKPTPTGTVTIRLTGETAGALTFQCVCSSNLVGEAAWFVYSDPTRDMDWAESSAWFVPSTNFTHTLSGNFVGGGKVRTFKLKVEDAASNAIVR